MVHGILLVQLSRPTVFFTPSLRVFCRLPPGLTISYYGTDKPN